MYRSISTHSAAPYCVWVFPEYDAYILNDQLLMHPFSVLTLGIFIAGYITARWDLVTRLYELAIFAADHGVVVSFVDYRRTKYRY